MRGGDDTLVDDRRWGRRLGHAEPLSRLDSPGLLFTATVQNNILGLDQMPFFASTRLVFSE